MKYNEIMNRDYDLSKLHVSHWLKAIVSSF